MNAEDQQNVIVELDENVEALADELREAERLVQLAAEHQSGAHNLRARLLCPLCE